jgi:hypothetical protein
VQYPSFTSKFQAKAALKFGSEAWALKKREEQRLEAAEMKFFFFFLGITKLDEEKNQCISYREPNRKEERRNLVTILNDRLQYIS